MATGILKRIHFAVEYRADSLDTTVVTSTNDLPAVNNDRADRDAAFSQTLSCFFNCSVEKRIHQYIVVGARRLGKTDISQEFGASSAVAIEEDAAVLVAPWVRLPSGKQRKTTFAPARQGLLVASKGALSVAPSE